MLIWNILNELPELFKPYIYFGNFKKYTVKERIELAKTTFNIFSKNGSKKF